jgi:hypothetical protein
MPTGAAILGAGALSAGASIWGANQAAGAQTQAAQNATAAQLQMFNAARGMIEPNINLGRGIVSGNASTLQGLLTPGANQTALLSQTPGFQFASDWGQRGVRNQATMRGLGGNVLTAGADYARNMALKDAWQPTISGLNDLTRTGAYMATGGAGQFGTLAGQTGGQVGSNMIGAGNAQAGAAMGTANAIGGFGNTMGNYAMLNSLTRNPGMYGSGSPGTLNPWNTSWGIPSSGTPNPGWAY